MFAEWVGSVSGLGALVLSYDSQAAIAAELAVVVVLAVIGVALFALVSALERALVPWWRAGAD